MLRRYKLLSLVAALLLLIVPAMAEETTAATTVPEPYRLVTEGSEYNLYLREDYMAIVLENRETGAQLWSAVQDESRIGANALGQASSGVVTQYLAVGGSSISTEVVDLISTGNTQVHTIAYEDLSNGFKAHVDYTALGISYDVIVELNGSDLRVTVPNSSIVQTKSASYRLATLTLFPFMGSSYKGEDTGYMLIPDGQGALIELKNNEKRYRSLYFDEQVYGKKLKDDKNDAGNNASSMDVEPVIMPVFGMAHTNKGLAFLGVIEQGDVAASIRAYPNGAVNLPFDRCSAQFEYNYKFTQMMGNAAGAGGMDATLPQSRSFDLVEHFLLLSGDRANYTGMAVAYRDYLDAHHAFDRAAGTGFEVQIDVLGLERENFVLGKQDVVMTTFEQAAAMLAELKSKGVDAMSMVLRGWQEGGLSAALPTDSYSPAGSLGGKGGMATLIAGAKSRKIPLLLECDFLTANVETHPVLTYNAFKKIDSQTWFRSTHGQVYGTIHYLTPSQTAQTASATLDQMKQNGVSGVVMVSMPSFLSDYYEQNAIRDVVQMAGIYGGVCESAAQGMSSSRLAAANAYLWPYADSLSDLPVTGSDYIFTTRDVPFLTIALSGRMPCYAEYTNFQANTNRFFLHLVEQGMRPAFLLTMADPIELKNTNSSTIYSSRFELYGDMIADWSRELGQLHQKLGSASIVGHEMQGDLTRVTWSNGVQVLLNFGDEALTADGAELAPMSYLVKEGGE